MVRARHDQEALSGLALGSRRLVAGMGADVLLAFLLDFDGLILDTESCSLASWAEEYSSHGLEAPVEQWRADAGRHPDVGIRFAELAAGSPASDRATSEARRLQRHLSLIAQEEPRPGVVDFVVRASALGHPLAVVSSSPGDWVRGHLSRCALLRYFDALVTGDMVARHKPAPDLYVRALAALDVPAEQAVAFEDAARGVHAARAAGVRCVAVPNAVTVEQDFAAASLRVVSFEAPEVMRLLGAGAWP